MLSTCLHWETICMKIILEKYDKKPPVCVGGKKGLTKSINAMIDLANPSHYDVNDEGPGVAIWMEKNSFALMDVYFSFLNISVKDNDGNACNGLLVKLKDGCIISWDGCSLCHCTSIWMDPHNPGNYFKPDPTVLDLFAFHFVNNGANLKLMQESHEREYQTMLGEPLGGEYNWEEFAH